MEGGDEAGLDNGGESSSWEPDRVPGVIGVELIVGQELTVIERLRYQW